MDNPLDEPWDVEWSSGDGSKAVLRVTRNEGSNPVFSWGKTSSGTFLGHPARNVRAMPVRSSRKFKRMADGTLQVYWRCSYEFRFQGE